MSTSRVQEGQHSPGKASQITTPSRVAQLSPFRRGSAPRRQSFEILAGDAIAMPRVGTGLGDVSEVPAVAKASSAAPFKPPKPIGLRAKKAKAVSISLLSGSSGAVVAAYNGQRVATDNEVSTTSTAQKRQSQVLLPVSPALQQHRSEENINDNLPARSQSAMGFYREHGPQKGLASLRWDDPETRGAFYSKKKKIAEASYRDENWDRATRSELFVISRKPSDRSSSTSASTTQPFDSHDHPGSLARAEPSSARQRSHSSLGMYGTNPSKASNASPSHPAAPAPPILRSPTAGVQGSSTEAKIQAKKKGTPSPLSMSSLTRRNSYFGELDRGPASAPMAAASSSSNLPQEPSQSPTSSLHKRTTSTFTQINLTSHIPKLLPRLRTQSHADALDSKSLSPPSFSSALPPPPRHKHSRTTGNDSTMLRVPSYLEEDHRQPRSSSPFDRGHALQSLGQQLGGIGAAVGRRGWDMMKSWNSAGSSSPSSSHSPKSPLWAPTPAPAAAPLNEATKKWIATPEPASSIPTRGGAVVVPIQVRPITRNGTTGGVFGKPLREAVLLTRLRQARAKTVYSKAQLSALDLGSDFSIGLPGLGSDKRSSPKHRVALNRDEARQMYLPAVVVRCVEAIERWGVEEEGIYRLSGRSSHTAKLKIIFDDSNRHNADLRLVDIGPADLDLNSVCSLLKAYLRALPDLLLTSALSGEFNEAVRGACGLSAIGEMTKIGNDQVRNNNTSIPPYSAGMQSHRVAKAIAPLMCRLPAVNWYLLRELAYHLGDLTREDNVRKTKMTLSNLCLVLAPTLSLSVAMVRMLVEAREELFGSTCPLPDSDLDDEVTEDIGGPPLPSRAVTSRMWDDDWTEKRTSVATVKAYDDTDKRDSTSSMATVQEASLYAAPGNEGISIASPRPTSDIFGLTDYNTGIRASPSLSFLPSDHDDDKVLLNAPPIAAQYLRKRSSSIADSIGSSSQQSTNSVPSARSVQISQLPSSTTLYSNAVHNTGSTFDSSVPSSSDRDSPRTTDGHWPLSIPSKGSLGGSSTSSGSLASKYKSSGVGPLDRPRPTTPNPMRFFSSASRT